MYIALQLQKIGSGNPCSSSVLTEFCWHCETVSQEPLENWSLTHPYPFYPAVISVVFFLSHSFYYLQLSLSCFICTASFVLVYPPTFESVCGSIVQKVKYKASFQHGSPRTLQHLPLSRTDQLSSLFLLIFKDCHSELERFTWEEQSVGASVQTWHIVTVMFEVAGEIPEYCTKK